MLFRSKPGERFHAERQQRFTDVKARKLFALENNYPPTGVCEQRRGRAASRSTADDSDVVNRVRHAAINLASLHRKQTLEAHQRQTVKRWSPTDARVCHLTSLVGNGRRRSVDLGQIDGEIRIEANQVFKVIR